MNREYAKKLLDQTRENYNEISSKFSDSRHKIWPGTKFLVEDYLMPGDRVLDLGCGNGRYFELMKEKDIEYFGVDNSQELIDIAKRRYLPAPGEREPEKAEAKFMADNALGLSFPSGYFDVVYSIAVLHHIPSHYFRFELLTQARRVLRPGGLFIATTWNLWQRPESRKLIYKFGWEKILGKNELDFKDILMNWHGKEFYFHCFVKKEFTKLIEKAGFNVKDEGEITVGQKRKGATSNSNFYVVAKKPEV